MSLPAYLQAQRDLSSAGTLLRFEQDGPTHGLVVGQYDGKIILFTGNSRSDVLNCSGEQHCWLLSQEDFNKLDPIYVGKIAPPTRVVSVESQSKPKYDPSQPGQYFYIEKPKEEAPLLVTPVDESKLPDFLHQQTQQTVKQPAMPKLRSDLTDPNQMVKALAIHIYQLEELHKVTANFVSGVNASMDYVRRAEQEADYRGEQKTVKELAPLTHRDPSGRPMHPEKRVDWVQAQKALVLLDKIRSGLETTGLMVVQYRNVVFELKKEVETFAVYAQHSSQSQVMNFRNWAMTYEEFAREWSLKLVQENRRVQDTTAALQKAWQRYRSKTAIYVQRLLTRYAEKTIAQKDFDLLEEVQEVKIETEEALSEIQEIVSFYDDASAWVDRIVESRGESNVMEPMLAAASQMYYVDKFEDAEPLIIKSAKLMAVDIDRVMLFDQNSFFVPDGMLVTAQAERIRRRKRNQPIIPIEKIDEPETSIEDILVPVSAPPNQVGPKQPPKKPQKKQPESPLIPVQAPPNQVGEQPQQIETVQVRGKPVPVIQPKELVKQKPPPPPTRILPPIPTPAEQEPVDFSDIPEEEWKDKPIPEKIRMAAVFRRLIMMEYMKITPPEDGVQKNYLLEVYSYRVKRPKRTNGSPVWYLYCFDVNDGHIKAYILKRIKNIEILDEKYEPRWEVEFAFNPQWNRYKKKTKQKPGIEVEQTDQPFFE